MPTVSDKLQSEPHQRVDQANSLEDDPALGSNPAVCPETQAAMMQYKNHKPLLPAPSVAPRNPNPKMFQDHSMFQDSQIADSSHHPSQLGLLLQEPTRSVPPQTLQRYKDRFGRTAQWVFDHYTMPVAAGEVEDVDFDEFINFLDTPAGQDKV